MAVGNVKIQTSAQLLNKDTACGADLLYINTGVSSKTRMPYVFQGLVIIVFHICSSSLSLSLSLPPSLYIVSQAQKHSLTDIPIISLPIALHLAAPAPSSSLLFPTWGEGERRDSGREEGSDLY